MNRWAFIFFLFLPLAAEAQDLFGEAYRRIWSDSVQTAIDQNIERYRKADAVIVLENVRPGSLVRVEQVSHDFLFGSNIFLFDQLDTPEKNEQYKNLFGTLFNGATLPFYWKTLEPEKGLLRFGPDSPFIFRRPPPDPIVDFCASRGIRMKGHAIVYGQRVWGHPTWMSSDRKEMEREIEDHVRILAGRYGKRIQNWDVVNECLDQAKRGIMPDDYTYKTYRWAMKYFPPEVTFNTNETDLRWGPTPRYTEIVRDLVDRGVRVDYMGVQMHIFKPEMSMDIARGKDERLTPQRQWAALETYSQAEKPIYISEVTVSAPDNSPEGLAVQKEIVYNFYRLWFSHPSVAGITWWNLVDGGAAPGEPSYSGLFDKDMKPKPSYYILDQLINHEWRTSLSVKAPRDGRISWRGFKGTYRISWTDRKGRAHTQEVSVR